MSTMHPLSDDLLLRKIDGELPPGEAGDVEAHLEQCADCQARWRTLGDVSSVLQRYSASVANPVGTSDARAALVAALRDRNRTAMRPSALPAWARLVPAFAALVLIVGSVMFWKQPGGRIVPPVDTAASQPADGMANGFISLPYSDENLSPEGAVVVQVELPRSALLLAGMPVSEGQSNERVKAEVVVGADGLARAIRFLN